MSEPIKPIVDLYGILAERGRIKCPDEDTLREVRRVLKMGYNQPFPKCKHKSKKKAELLDVNAGISPEDIAGNRGVHTRRLHVCSECRCDKIAGEGSRGYWYWKKDSPFGEAGHYGVGPCYSHGAYSNAALPNMINNSEYVEMIRAEIETMQNIGAAPDASGQWLVQVRKDVEQAIIRNELRETVEEVKQMATDLKTKLEGSQLVTEMYRGEEVPMCDKTKYELRLKLIKSISDMAKTELDAGQWDLYHKDEIRMMIDGVLSGAELVFRPKVSDDEWQDFICLFKQAVDNMRAGRKK